MFLPNFEVLCDLPLNRRTATWNLFILYKKKHTTSAFYFKIFLNYSKVGLCSLWQTRKKPFDVICCLYKMKQSHWLLCITRNCDWSRKITPLSNLTQMAFRGMKTDRESRIKLWNLQMLKKMLEKSTEFLSSKQSCRPKSLNISFNIAGGERIARKTCSENMRLR